MRLECLIVAATFRLLVLFSPRMQFRAKFRAYGYISVSLACFGMILWLSGIKSRNTGSFACFWTIVALLFILHYIFIYWELDSDSLRERRLWNKKEVAWKEVTHVGNWTPTSDFLAVDYARPAPMSDCGQIIANPEDRLQFIAALRRFAPNAEFDV